MVNGLKHLEQSTQQESKAKKTWLKSIFKKLIRAEAIIVIWESKNKFKMSNNLDNQAAVAEVLVQLGNESMGQWDSYQKTVLDAHKKKIAENKSIKEEK